MKFLASVVSNKLFASVENAIDNEYHNSCQRGKLHLLSVQGLPVLLLNDVVVLERKYEGSGLVFETIKILKSSIIVGGLNILRSMS